MRFSAVHKVASYLMIASAFAALALSRELEPALVGFTLLAGIASYWVEPARSARLRSRAWTTAWNTATLVAFLWTAVEAIRGEPLAAGVRFLCLLLVNKLWNRRASRDWQQAYVLSFLMLVAGAAMNSDLGYAACFLAYVVFSTWTLTLFHLRREMEENYLLKHSDDAQSERVEVERILNSRRIVGAGFLAGTGAVSLGIFAGATLVFFLIPRFGFGLFAAKGRRGVATVGFSDRVDLGEYGLVKDNPQVVMRVELPKGPPLEALHLRGVSFDRYQHGHWTRTPAVPPTSLRRQGPMGFVDPPVEGRLSPARARGLLEGTLVQHVYLEPLDAGVLFGAGRPVAFELRPAGAETMVRVQLEGRSAGEVYAIERHFDPRGRIYTSERKSGLRYTVYSAVSVPSDEALAALPDPTIPARAELQPYLALPEGLPERIGELAGSITAGQVGPLRKARTLERYLQRRYRYTLELGRDERYEPLEDFLFVQRAGHCEYFASAMAVMLRTLGVPSRVVNGFLGGDWNAYGNYLAVRHGDAHAWVEVWIDGAGWVSFDPTPTAPAAIVSRGTLYRLRQMLDTLELAWFKYVIEYDLSKQVDLVRDARGWMRSATDLPSLRDRLKLGLRPLLGGAALALGLALLGWRLRRRLGLTRRVGSRRSSAARAYARALRALERRGHLRGPGETGRELATRVQVAADPAGPAFTELVELYYAARFGGAEVPYDHLDQLASQVVHPPAPERRVV